MSLIQAEVAQHKPAQGPSRIFQRGNFQCKRNDQGGFASVRFLAPSKFSAPSGSEAPIRKEMSSERSKLDALDVALNARDTLVAELAEKKLSNSELLVRFTEVASDTKGQLTEQHWAVAVKSEEERAIALEALAYMTDFLAAVNEADEGELCDADEDAKQTMELLYCGLNVVHNIAIPVGASNSGTPYEFEVRNGRPQIRLAPEGGAHETATPVEARRHTPMSTPRDSTTRSTPRTSTSTTTRSATPTATTTATTTSTMTAGVASTAPLKLDAKKERSERKRLKELLVIQYRLRSEGEKVHSAYLSQNTKKIAELVGAQAKMQMDEADKDIERLQKTATIMLGLPEGTPRSDVWKALKFKPKRS